MEKERAIHVRRVKPYAWKQDVGYLVFKTVNTFAVPVGDILTKTDLDCYIYGGGIDVVIEE